MESLTPSCPPARAPEGPRPHGDPSVLEPPRLPAAARPALGDLFLLTLLSAVDGSIVALAAGGALSSPGGAVAVGLTVVAGAGSWLAAHRAFGGRRLGGRDHALLALLGLLSAAATVAATWAGVRLGTAMTLHVLPKAAGVVLWLVAAEVAGVRLPRPGRVPLPLVALAAGAALEWGVRWSP